MSVILDVVEDVLRREGDRFTHDPQDWPTKWGIIPPTLAEYRGVPTATITSTDIQALSREAAIDIYLRLFYFKPHFDRLQGQPRLLALMFDWGVTSGPRTAIKALQRVVGVATDGRLGPQTCAALAGQSVAGVMVALKRARWEQMYRAAWHDVDPVVTRRLHSTTDVRYLKGWGMRLQEY